jgi:hypothetical protein
MNKTVELVNTWADFEKKHPDGDIKDFCRYQLIHQREIENNDPLVGGVIPENVDGLLLKIMGRISRMNMVYAYTAFAGTGVDQLEEFGILLTIHRRLLKNVEQKFSALFQEHKGKKFEDIYLSNRMPNDGKIANPS